MILIERKEIKVNLTGGAGVGDDLFFSSSSSFFCWLFGKLRGSVKTSNGTDGCWYVAGSYKFHGIVCPNVPILKIFHYRYSQMNIFYLYNFHEDSKDVLSNQVNKK